MCWKAASSIWYWKRVSLLSATGPSGATPSSGGICASVVVVIVIADDVTAPPELIATATDAEADEGGEMIPDADEDVTSGNPEDEMIEVAFTVEVVLLLLLPPLPPAGREPPLPRPAVDAAKKGHTELFICIIVLQDLILKCS